MTTQPEALRLADSLRDGVPYDEAEIENELRRLAQVEGHRNQLLRLAATDSDEWNPVSTVKARAAIKMEEGK